MGMSKNLGPEALWVYNMVGNSTIIVCAVEKTTWEAASETQDPNSEWPPSFSATHIGFYMRNTEHSQVVQS